MGLTQTQRQSANTAKAFERAKIADAICALRARGLTERAIANKLGIGQSKVNRTLRREMQRLMASAEGSLQQWVGTLLMRCEAVAQTGFSEWAQQPAGQRQVRWADAILGSVQKAADLLGIAPPAPVTSDTSGINLGLLGDAQLETLAGLVAVASGAPVPPEPEPREVRRDVIVGGSSPTARVGFRRTTPDGEPSFQRC